MSDRTQSFQCCMCNKLIKQVKLFTWLEADGLAGCDADLGSRPRIAADPCLTGTHIEHAKSAQLNSFSAGERLLHAVEDGVYSSLRLRARQPCTFHNSLDKVLLNQRAPSLKGILTPNVQNSAN